MKAMFWRPAASAGGEKGGNGQGTGRAGQSGKEAENVRSSLQAAAGGLQPEPRKLLPAAPCLAAPAPAAPAWPRTCHARQLSHARRVGMAGVQQQQASKVLCPHKALLRHLQLAVGQRQLAQLAPLGLAVCRRARQTDRQTAIRNEKAPPGVCH
jgi:hypothetical protein